MVQSGEYFMIWRLISFDERYKNDDNKLKFIRFQQFALNYTKISKYRFIIKLMYVVTMADICLIVQKGEININIIFRYF